MDSSTIHLDKIYLFLSSKNILDSSTLKLIPNCNIREFFNKVELLDYYIFLDSDSSKAPDISLLISSIVYICTFCNISLDDIDIIYNGTKYAYQLNVPNNVREEVQRGLESHIISLKYLYI